MTVTAIGPSWGAMGRAEQPYPSAGPAELTITVQVTVSGSVAPGSCAFLGNGTSAMSSIEA